MPATAHIRFLYDVVCPYAFLASLRVDDVARKLGATIAWEPILLGGVFRAIGAPDRPRMSEGRARYNLVDLERQARRAGVTLRPPSDHPRRTVLALRAALASSDHVAASRALFAAYWLRGEAVDDPEVVRAALDGAGLDGAAALAAADTSAIKDELRARTDRAVTSGVFGVPTMILGDRPDDLYWGNDRLDFLLPPAAPSADRPIDPSRRVEFYFDFSSPYAYLASTQIRALARRAGAVIDYRPILLGGLFKAIDTPNVPIFEMAPSKRLYQGVELGRWAARWNVPFRFSSRFPIQTTKALRLVLAAPEGARPPLIHAIFEAVWALDRDVTLDETLAYLASAAGLDWAELGPRITTDEVKQDLRRRTDEAKERGAFGVPTFFAGGEMFWGQDRLDALERALEA